SRRKGCHVRSGAFVNVSTIPPWRRLDMAWQIEEVPTDAERLEELKERIVWHPNNVFREGAPLAVVKAALLPHSLTETGRRELADLTQSFINQARLLSVSPDRLIGACALVRSEEHTSELQ